MDDSNNILTKNVQQKQYIPITICLKLGTDVNSHTVKTNIIETNCTAFLSYIKPSDCFFFYQFVYSSFNTTIEKSKLKIRK